MKYEIRHIDPLSAAKIVGIINGIIGLLAAVVWYLLLSVAFGSVASTPSLTSSLGVEILWPILIIVVISAIGGFLCGLIFAAIYNWLAPEIGGIKLEIDLIEKDR